MYYAIENSQIQPSDEESFLKKEDTIAVFTSSEWEEKEKLQNRYQINTEDQSIHLCKVENHAGYLYATIKIPPKEMNEISRFFSFYLLPEKVIMIDDGQTVLTQIEKIVSEKYRKSDTLERFIYDFLVSFIDDDLLFLQNLEQKISKIEEEVLRGCCPDFNIRMLYLKKKIAKFYRYYSQLTQMGQELLDNEMDFFGKEDLKMFDRFKDRASRLGGETQLLREYAMQVQDVYQSEISIRQNDVMKMLTVVTTIFLPLTLIAGWYGMNFSNMPELSSKYGYPVIIGISAVIVILSLIIFKKKKYW